MVVSFDIDGTLEAGDPPGPVTMAMVRNALAHGCIIGSCSDRPVPVQQAIWDRFDIPVSFTSPKHRLSEVRARFPADVYYHIGDTELDRQFAQEAAFQFLWMDVGPSEPWLHHGTVTGASGGPEGAITAQTRPQTISGTGEGGTTWRP